MKNLFWNWVGGFIDIARGIIVVITFGTILPSWQFRYCVWLLNNNHYHEKTEAHE